jgi:SAM-dependent methyltransferase
MAPTYEELDRYYHNALDGHIWIRETIATLLERLSLHVATSAEPPCILELGSHTGFITQKLLQRWPSAQFYVWEEDPSLLEFARRRVSASNVHYHSGPLEQLPVRVNIVISVARHHHLPQDYLQPLARVLAPGAVYILADELCPEYCTSEDKARIANAPMLDVAGGYLLTSKDEERLFTQRGQLPLAALELESRRRRALWQWYRFVVDHAVERGYFDIAAGELQSAADDMITGSDAEHKFSPFIVERQLTLAGFRCLGRHPIGGTTDPEKQAMFVFEFERTGSFNAVVEPNNS